MGAVHRLSSEAQLAMTAKNGLISLVFVALYLLCISCQPCQGDDDHQAKNLFKRETRKSFLSYFWPTYNTRSTGEEPNWWYYNKRAPGSEFLGKRAPGSEFLGKRSHAEENNHQEEVEELYDFLRHHPKRSLEVPLSVEQRNDRNRFDSN